MKKPDLVPCPHCGGAKLRIDDDGGIWPGDDTPDTFWVVCLTCWASGGPTKSRKEAAVNWNKRVDVDVAH
jgi:Lar family restriction alleviation protein